LRVGLGTCSLIILLLNAAISWNYTVQVLIWLLASVLVLGTVLPIAAHAIARLFQGSVGRVR